MKKLAIMTILFTMTGAVASQAADQAAGAALFEAAARGQATLIGELAGAADMNARDGTGATALILAADAGHIKAVKMLIANGADIDARDTQGRTALMHAALNNDAHMFTYLLAKGADASLTDKDGRTAQKIARSYGYAELAKMEY